MSDVLRLAEVRKSFIQAENRLDILTGCDLTVGEGELVALIGPSGAGKSTLLHIAGLLEQPSSGSILIGGEEASKLNDAGRTALRRKYIGFVYQAHLLQPEFSARENIMIPQMIAGVSSKEAGVRADELLALIGLTKRASHRPAQLSGGEQQRVAIARALANRPKLLIADEPTGNLDPATADHVFDMLRDLVKSQGLGLLMATHNHDLAAKMGRVVQLRDGRIA
jgi:lipoprotein-releasing system ATP-binding protein